ncbi:MAG: hypothetical protein JW795_13805 [Chitinivibrionales bacterium]|nr:hypothetical protein [Chitinivibrionales bacterium]
MDIAAILIKVTGLVFLLWTVRSIVLHVREKRTIAQSKKEVQSISEQILNNVLLYLWLAFMLVFSAGMIINN